MNIVQFDRLYRARITGAGATGSTVTLKLPRVKPGRIRVLTHVSLENRTNNFTEARLSVNDGAHNFYLDQATSPQATELLGHSKDIILGEGDELHAIFTGTTTGDILEMHAIGWEMPREKYK